MRVFVVPFDNFMSVQVMFGDAGYDVSESYSDAELAVFCGGADVSPSLYGEENISSWTNPERDKIEKEYYDLFKEREIPSVGICRGGQFLNVMNGGKLIQDIDGHGMGRRVISGGFIIHEDHHQAIVPTEEAEVIAVAEDEIVEVCYYHKTRDLCFQPHPEWGHEGTRKYFFNLLTEKGMK